MENFLKALGIISAVVVITIILAWPVQVLWNISLVPAVDGIHPITFWQALGINLLATILFKSTNTPKKND